jgi:predicted dehydrogenase
MSRRADRRQLLKSAALAGAGFWIAGSAAPAASRSPSEKLNIGVIGSGGRGHANTDGVVGPNEQNARENLVALCDTNESVLESRAKQFPKAKRYTDWRKLLEQKDVDAVIVSTPDHHHALASVAAMKLGKHVYCEKPVAHSVYEARVVQDTYKKMKGKVATQMGTQVHAEENYRRVVELIQSGAIGPVREAHVWCDRVGFGPGTTRPKDTPPVPNSVHWDLWLGPAPERPYHPSYFGGCMIWEQWWDFGNGCIGDMGSHLIDLPFWALRLRQPLTVEAEGANRSDECYPQWLIVRWEHPATKRRPGLKLTWYDGGKKPPSPPGHDLKKWGIGVLFEGEKGKLLADYGRCILLPEDQFRDHKFTGKPIPRSLGHYQEWIHACKTGAPTLCNFDYSGMLVEHNLLGTAAFRVGKKLTWEPKSMKAVDCPEADQYIRREYRPGWEI